MNKIFTTVANVAEVPQVKTASVALGSVGTQTINRTPEREGSKTISSANRAKGIVLALGLATATTGFAQTAVAASNQQNLERCMTAVTQGPQKNGIKFYGIKFNCKPWNVSKVGQSTAIKGQISHDIRWRPDDQVNYEFTIARDGQLTPDSLDISIQRGGVGRFLPSPLSDKVEDIADSYVYGQSANIYNVVKNIVSTNKGWEGKAIALVYQVIAEAKNRYRSRLSN